MIISYSLYNVKNNEWWKGKKVKSIVPLSTKGGQQFAAGTIFTVQRKFGGFTLVTDNEANPRRIKKVWYTELELLEQL